MNTRTSKRRGNYSLLMGVSITSILGFGALGVDISYIAMANTQATAVADAASHAALLTYRQHPSPNVSVRENAGMTAANWIVQNNKVGLDGPGNLTTLDFGIFDSGTGQYASGGLPHNAARAVVTREGGNGIELFLAPILSFDRADVNASGVTVANPREIIVVIDRSGSMDWGSPINGKTGTDLALTAFSNYMVDHQVPEDRLGATAFNSGGSWWYPFRYVEDYGPDIRSKWSQWDLESMGGNTNQAAGINIAVNALKNSGNDSAFKAIIVISDGNPNPYSTRAPTFRSSTVNAWNNGIHVWTVSFGQDIDHALMEECTKGIGTYYSTPDATGLTQVMLNIAESIPVALVD